MSDGRVVSGTIAELVFKEEDFATCSAEEDMSFEGCTRRNKGGKIFRVNIGNMVEEDGNVWSSKSKAGDGEPLERCNVDFSPNKKMESMVRLGMVNMLNCEEQVVNIIKPMTGEEITKVVEVRNRLISSMAVDHIVMVDTVHG